MAAHLPARFWLARPWSLVAILLTTLSGCGQVFLRPADALHLLRSFEASLSAGDTLSPRTLQTLRQLDLEVVYQDDPAEAFRRLQSEALRDPQPDTLFALAEMAYAFGQQCGAGNACVFYYLSAGYAYHYLFDKSADTVSFGKGEPERTAASPFDPRYRLACDLYNAALSHCMRTAQQAGRLDPRQQLHLPTPDGQTFMLTVQHHGFTWGPEEFGPLLICSDYQVEGLANQHRTYGLGVPLIGTRRATRPAARHAYYPDAVSFPVSAFFRFEGSLADLHTQRAGTLELYNPLQITKITVRGREVPLETDLTTPLAYFLAHTDLQTVEVRGFLRPDEVSERTGIYMLEPYQPGKIPVLMIHGLLSSPLTWAPLFNDLRADPELRSRYQFWFFLYPTGPGYLQAAAELRRDLAQLRAELDPEGKDPALDNMVLVGHSMGGLVARLLTVASGDDFWQLVSRQPVQELPLPPEIRSELQQVFYFEPQPYVRRVVFLGTPHRGSLLSPSPLGRLAARLVHTPQLVLETTQQLIQTPPATWGMLWQGKPATSVDLLAPDSPALQLLVARPKPEGVHFHSIIGRALPRTLWRELTRPIVGNEITDGVVPYASSHLIEAESELIVPADHFTVHHHPLTVREVRRILLEHSRSAAGDLAPQGER